MALYLLLFCVLSFFNFIILNELQVSLSITPHEHENVTVFNENDRILYYCNVNGVIPDGVSLFWYQKLKGENTQTLRARNDNNSIKKNVIYSDTFIKQYDMSEIYCIARIFDGKFHDVGRSQSIYLVLNKTDLKDENLGPNEDITKNETVIKHESEYNNNPATPYVIFSIVAILIMIVLILAVIYLYRKNKLETQEHTNSIYSHARSDRYRWPTQLNVTPYAVSNCYKDSKPKALCDIDGIYEELM